MRLEKAGKCVVLQRALAELMSPVGALNNMPEVQSGRNNLLTAHLFSADQKAASSHQPFCILGTRAGSALDFCGRTDEHTYLYMHVCVSDLRGKMGKVRTPDFRV